MRASATWVLAALTAALTAALAGCSGGPAPLGAGPGAIVLPSASLSVATTTLTLRVAPDAAGYRVATIAGTGSAVKLTIEGLDFGSMSRTATGSLDTAVFVVENAPAGKNRVITLQALDGSGNAVAGSALRTAADLAAGSQTLEISARSTAVGDVFARFLQTQGGRQVIGSASPAAVANLMDAIKGTAPRVAHYALIDAGAVADAIVGAGGTLPAPSAAFQLQAAKVRITVLGAPHNVPLQAWVGDPASPRNTGLSRLGSQTGDVYEIATVAPGSWPVTVVVPRLGTRTGTVNAGAGQTSALSFDFSTWQDGPALPSAVGAVGAAAIGSRIYAIGGVEAGGRATDSVYVLDTAATSPAWQKLSRLPTPREAPGVGVLNGKIVVAGGQATTDAGTTRLGTVEIYNPQTDTWTTGSRLPTAFLSGSTKAVSWGGLPAASTGSRLLAFQGIADYGITLAAAAEYDPLADNWITQNTPVPMTPRIMGAAAFLGNRLYLAGGLRPANPTYNPGATTQFPLGARPEFEFLDITGSPMVWRAAEPLSTGRAELALAASKSKIYAAGGVGPGDKAYSLVEVFDPAAGSWGYAGSMRSPRSSFGLVAAGNKLWAIGGSQSRALGYFGGGSALATNSVEVMPLPEGSL